MVGSLVGGKTSAPIGDDEDSIDGDLTCRSHIYRRIISSLQAFLEFCS